MTQRALRFITAAQEKENFADFTRKVRYCRKLVLPFAALCDSA